MSPGGGVRSPLNHAAYKRAAARKAVLRTTVNGKDGEEGAQRRVGEGAGSGYTRKGQKGRRRREEWTLDGLATKTLATCSNG
ncbi:hypothetical protein Plec18167_000224 [Paecilomyces lecythidis]|uniref:Uncharacterized protein n=1 Tax=Paecilomyces lecythidis TaxID=3004212 RepID=A0ABR3YE48_9EURO